MMYMLEGYRARVLDGGDADPPYSPGGARDLSWRTGYAKAGADLITSPLGGTRGVTSDGR